MPFLNLWINYMLRRMWTAMFLTILNMIRTRLSPISPYNMMLLKTSTLLLIALFGCGLTQTRIGSSQFGLIAFSCSRLYSMLISLTHVIGYIRKAFKPKNGDLFISFCEKRDIVVIVKGTKFKHTAPWKHLSDRLLS